MAVSNRSEGQSPVPVDLFCVALLVWTRQRQWSAHAYLCQSLL